MNINPLSICNKRKISFLPPHFSKLQINNGDLFFDDSLLDWIESKLNGRYTVVNSPCIGKDGKLTTATFVAFEDSKELTFFMLAYPNLRRI